MHGGIMIYGNNMTTGARFARAYPFGTMSLPNGNWRFLAIALDGGGSSLPFEGILRCASAIIPLEGEEAQINLTLAQNNCTSELFGKLESKTSGQPNTLKVYNCDSSVDINDNSSHDSCSVGNMGSFKVILPEIQLNGDIGNDGIASVCMPTAGNPLIPTDIVLPFFELGASNIPFGIESFSDAACTTSLELYKFEQGHNFPAVDNIGRAYTFTDPLPTYPAENRVVLKESITISSAPMITKWDSPADKTITLPLVNGGTYNFTVDWGDTTQDVITSWDQLEATHTFPAAGVTYTVSISGIATHWSFNNGAGQGVDKDAIVEVTQLGELGWTNFSGAFYGCTNLATFTPGTTDTSAVTNLQSMFHSASSLSGLDLFNFNTSAVTDMSFMFRSTSSLTNLNLSSFNTSAVTDMSRMFETTPVLTSLNLSSFNTSAVTTMLGMFSGASNLTTLDLLNFNTSAVTSMKTMFYTASSLTSLNVSSFSTIAVADMWGMFYNTSNLTTLDLSSFNTSAVTEMSWMFKSASNLTSLDLSNFNISAVTDMSSMFNGASALTALNTTNWDTDPLPTSTDWILNMSGTIYCNDPDGGGTGDTGTGTINTTTNCASIHTDTDGDGIADIMESLLGFNPAVAEADSDGDKVPNTYDTDATGAGNNDSDSDGISDDLEALVATNAPNWVGDLDGDGDPYGTDSNPFAAPPAPMITTWRVGDAAYGDGDETITLPLRSGFYYFFTVDWGDGTSDVITAWDQTETTHDYALTTGPGDYTVTISGTAEAWYFNNSGDKDKILSVTQLGELGWTSFEGAFYGCTNLATFTPGITDTSAVTNMHRMFNNASSLTSLNNLSNFDTSAVTTMEYMFLNASSLTSLDLSNFNTSNVTNMTSLISSTNVTAVDLTNFVTSNVITMGGMFANSPLITVQGLSGFDTSNVINMSYMFNGTSGIATVDLGSTPYFSE